MQLKQQTQLIFKTKINHSADLQNHMKQSTDQPKTTNFTKKENFKNMQRRKNPKVKISRRKKTRLATKTRKRLNFFFTCGTKLVNLIFLEKPQVEKKIKAAIAAAAEEGGGRKKKKMMMVE